MKLYPPYIEEKLPAFTKENNQAVIAIPYILNPTIGRSDFNTIQLRLRTTQDKEIGTFNTNSVDNGIASFTIVNNENATPLDSINQNQFYKAQIAFIGKDNQVGMFSSVGIIKCVYNTTASIQAEEGSLYYYVDGFTGTVDFGDNTGEKVQQYCFTLTDSFNQMQETSGWLNHDNSKDTDTDTWIPKTYLIPNEEYSVKYEVITNNLYKISSSDYIVKNVEAEKSENDTVFWTKIYPNPEKGKIVIHLFKLDLNSFELQPIDCQFRILRRQVNTEAWIELFNSTTHVKSAINAGRFSTAIPPQVKIIDLPLPYVFEDYTTEQGVSYEYAVQEVKNGIKCQKQIICNRSIKTDFEDMFLYDGKTQLRIAFNPKVSSFKTTILESKHDTIGGKYPFFFRNGDVNYKEFPISGLISINMDEEFFQSKFANSTLDSEDGLGIQERRNETRSKQVVNPIVGTNLTTDIIRTEREYKLAVLDWLNDGKPKLFRSPTEGNYLVRLMNVSLTPNDTLGRMIHTFNATAYEIGPADTQSLISSGFLGQINTPSDFTLQPINMEG